MAVMTAEERKKLFGQAAVDINAAKPADDLSGGPASPQQKIPQGDIEGPETGKIIESKQPPSPRDVFFSPTRSDNVSGNPEMAKPDVNSMSADDLKQYQLGSIVGRGANALASGIGKMAGEDQTIPGGFAPEKKDPRLMSPQELEADKNKSIRDMSRGMLNNPEGNLVSMSANTDPAQGSVLNIQNRDFNRPAVDPVTRASLLQGNQPTQDKSPAPPTRNSVDPNNMQPGQGYIRDESTGKMFTTSGAPSTEASAFSQNYDYLAQGKPAPSPSTQPVQVPQAVAARSIDIPAPSYLTPEQAKALGLGWKSRIAENNRRSGDYHAKLQALGLNDSHASLASVENARNYLSRGTAESRNAIDLLMERERGQNHLAATGIAKTPSPLEQQLFGLRAEYTTPGTSPGRRQELERQMQIISGHSIQTPEGKIFQAPGDDGLATVPMLLNHDGTTKQLWFPPVPKNQSDIVLGRKYQTVNGPATWDGKIWTKVNA